VAVVGNFSQGGFGGTPLELANPPNWWNRSTSGTRCV